jgi:hypothetical protein
MRFNDSVDVVQGISGVRFNVRVADHDPRVNSQMMAEYSLVEAVLREAIREYQKFAGQQGRRSSRLFREVHAWFLEDDRKWDFSFINVCQILDLEPGYIRTGLKMWSDRNVRPDAAHELRKVSPRRARRRQENLGPVGAETVTPRL